VPTRPRPLLLALTILWIGGAIWTLTRPAFSEDRPRRLSLVFHQDADTASARWLIDGDLGLPPALSRTVGEFTGAPAFAWTPLDEPSWISPTAPIAAAPPELVPVPDTLRSRARGVVICACACGRLVVLAARRS
jgi:hypothetical protein